MSADPVVVLTYAQAGEQRLRSLLAGFPELACTIGTGMLPLCEQAALTWQRTEGRDGPPSALALASIRALAGGIITVLLAHEGKPRWCEIATAPPACAETFLHVYPDTRFLCLHRNCADVIRSVMRANPWGLPDHEFGAFSAIYPGRSATALAAYWTARTDSLLKFEASHPGICFRIRYEDVARDPCTAAGKLAESLGLAFHAPWPPADEEGDDTGDAPVPAEQIPPALRSTVDALLTRLCYPPLS